MLLWTPAHSHSGCTSNSHATLRLEIYAPPKQPGTPNPELGAAPRAHGFAWQNGYGAFSVSEPNAQAVIAYIAKPNIIENSRLFSKNSGSGNQCVVSNSDRFPNSQLEYAGCQTGIHSIDSDLRHVAIRDNDGLRAVSHRIDSTPLRVWASCGNVIAQFATAGRPRIGNITNRIVSGVVDNY